MERPSQVRLIEGIFIASDRSPWLDATLEAFGRCEGEGCQAVYDLSRHEFVAVRNAAAWQVEGRSPDQRFLPSDVALAAIEPSSIRARVEGLARSRQLQVGEENRYSVIYRVPDFGRVRVDLVSRRLVGDEDGTTVVISDVGFTVLEDSSQDNVNRNDDSRA